MAETQKLNSMSLRPKKDIMIQLQLRVAETQKLNLMSLRPKRNIMIKTQMIC